MRLIGHLADETQARTFGDYLYAQGIQNQAEHDKEKGWAVWIQDEDQIERASQMLTAFRQNPNDSKYTSEAAKAAKLRAADDESREAYRKRVRNRRHLFRPLTGYGFGPLSFVLIVVSVVVFVLSKFGTEHEPIMKLFITSFEERGGYIEWVQGLPEIHHGEFWRLITPIFIHFSPLHIFFNLLWLQDLGSMIEARHSTWFLAIFVVVIAVCSNLAQFYWAHTPDFGGMSGIVYGLLGYVWIRGKFDPGSGLFLHPWTVSMMIIWFFLCYTGWVGAIANTVHAVGLGMGMAWGYLSSLRYR
jgi:GlpG protein